MENVLSYIRFALSHAKKSSVPKGANLPYVVGDDGEWEYIYGGLGQVCTQAYLDRKFEKVYSKEMTRAEFDKITAGWVENKVHVTDCEGLLDAYLHIDINADENYRKFCTDKGLISAIKRTFVVGEAVFNGTESKKTHVGWICGFVNDEPLVVEAKGFRYGVVVTKLGVGKWAYRGLMKNKFLYTDDYPIPDPPVYVFTRELKKGCKGDDVIELKKLLIAKGYNKGITVDTKNSKYFGSSTKKLVKEFQASEGYTIDGIAGRNTINALGGVYV